MAVMTGLSGHEVYCLAQKGMTPGDLVIGNSVFSVGFVGGLGSVLKTLAGGEVTQITSVIHEGGRRPTPGCTRRPAPGAGSASRA